MVRIALAAVFALVLAAAGGCGNKSATENTGVALEKNPDPKAPGPMKPPVDGNSTLPKNAEKPRK